MPEEPKRFSKIVRFLRRPAVIGGVSFVVLGTVLTLAWLQTQQKLDVALANQQSLQVMGPLKVDFNQDVAAGFETTLEPAVDGTWSEERTILGVSAIVFEPKSRFEAGRSYTLRIKDLKRVGTGASIPDVEQKFATQKAAAIKSSSPAENAKNVPVKPTFTVELTTANQGVRGLRATLVPAVPLKMNSDDDKTFTWVPETPLKQGTAYSFRLEDARVSDPTKAQLVTIPFTTVAQPVIKSARTGGYFTPGQVVDIVFDQPMEADTAAFAFDVGGKGAWADNKTYRFTPEGIKPGTTYSYKVKAGLKSVAGGVIEADRPYQFATNGAVTGRLSPSGSGVGVTTPIRVAFDQEVDRASAQGRFAINPAVAGSFSWSGNTMTFSPAGLAYQTAYTVNVAGGVVPKWGLPSARTLGVAFTTTTQTIKLNVPLYKQTFGNGCELTSLRMVLGFYGIGATEWDIVQRIGYNPRNRDTGSNSWDNPNVTFVGHLNGYQNSSGYGVHAQPIANAAKTYGHNATAHYNVSAQFIASQIHAGRPVIFWGHSTPAKLDGWNTPQGYVQSWLSSHARVAYGVTGSPSNPTGFYINDPWRGNTFYWTAAQLMSNMNVLPSVSNQAVVVY